MFCILLPDSQYGICVLRQSAKENGLAASKTVHGQQKSIPAMAVFAKNGFQFQRILFY